MLKVVSLDFVSNASFADFWSWNLISKVELRRFSASTVGAALLAQDRRYSAE